MKYFVILLTVFLGFSASPVNSQIVQREPDYSNTQVAAIASELKKISKAVTELGDRLKNFSETFSSNQGLQLTERQQKLLAAFEYLNRAEQRLANLQRLKLDLSEKQTTLRIQMAKVEDDLRPESIDRGVAFRGTTSAEEIRENRRQFLNRQKNEINRLMSEIQVTLDDTNQEIRQTELFIKNIRHRIFPEIEKDLLDL